MKLQVSDAAHHWFIKELGLSPGDNLRIFGKYGGNTSVHVGFSTGIQVAEPEHIALSFQKEGIQYYTESSDDWFFSDYKLFIDLDVEADEPIYQYI